MDVRNALAGRVLHQWAGTTIDRHLDLASNVLINLFKIRGVTPQRYFFGASAVLGLLFGIITEPESTIFWGSHHIMWLLQTLLPVSILVFVHIGLHANSTFDALNPWLKLFISGLIGALVFVPIALGIDILWGNNPQPESFSAFKYLLFDEAAGAVPPVLISWMAINAPWLLFFKEETEGTESVALEIESSTESNFESLSQSNKTTEINSGFQSLVSPTIQGTLLYIKSELHYLLIVTDKGKELILYNLSDAMSELSPRQGIQCHRSFWVAKNAIRSIKKEGRQGLLKLINDDEIPVSRTRFNEVKDYVDVTDISE
uniref:LytTR family DNA-binding domain-containing protein n=1 Tax=Cellvibrio fontiphilus TaxID=1815559 RepID=UPI002B4BECFF|nr:LytTR family DNA-binding domain-containing protein [Cellvibrio fontiphilus]